MVLVAPGGLAGVAQRARALVRDRFAPGRGTPGAPGTPGTPVAPVEGTAA
jgi:hypothetical protein